MLNQKIGLRRNTIDKYYTNKNVVSQCMNIFNKYINVLSNDLIIEPSAGNGSFINEIKDLKSTHLFYDLEPEHSEVIKQNYLTLDVNTYKYNKIHIIGNPPFGRQSSLAIKFIKKSCEYCDTISFILPKSFKKDSMKKRFPLVYHLIVEIDLPNNSFLVGGTSHNVPCVFQIWEKRNYNRPLSIKLIPNHYRFVKKKEDADLSFRRVGVNAGKLDRNIENKSEQSHYFIKYDSLLTDDLFNTLSNINYDCKNNTVGPKSISKQELIKEFNMVF